MAREMNSEEAKILKWENEFLCRLENNGLGRIERRAEVKTSTSEFSSQSSVEDRLAVYERYMNFRQLRTGTL